MANKPVANEQSIIRLPLRCLIDMHNMHDGFLILGKDARHLLTFTCSLSLAAKMIMAACKLYLVSLIVFVYATKTQGNGSVLKVQTESGAVVGKIETLPIGKSVHEYLGIPYAEPPVGELRFAAPKPVKPWSGIKEAKEFGAACPQPQLPFLPSKVDEG